MKEFKEHEQTLKEIESYLRLYYRKILDTYKYLSSQLGASIWQINQNTLTSFVNSCEGVITSKYSIHEALVQESIVKGYDLEERLNKKNKNIPDNLIRHQFLNFLIKLSISSYMANKGSK